MRNDKCLKATILFTCKYPSVAQTDPAACSAVQLGWDEARPFSRGGKAGCSRITAWSLTGTLRQNMHAGLPSAISDGASCMLHCRAHFDWSARTAIAVVSLVEAHAHDVAHHKVWITHVAHVVVLPNSVFSLLCFARRRFVQIKAVKPYLFPIAYAIDRI